MTDLELRNLAIATMRGAGFGLRRIGHAVGLSHTQVRRILEQLAEHASSTFRSENFPTLPGKAREPRFRAAGRSTRPGYVLRDS